MSGSVTVADSSLLLLDWGRLDCLRGGVEGIRSVKKPGLTGGGQEDQRVTPLLIFQERVIGFPCHVLQSLRVKVQQHKNSLYPKHQQHTFLQYYT